MRPNPYDELPYSSVPIEWTAPERLALTSLLHGGPRAPLHGYRVLELGCGDGTNLIPLAYYRRHATFVGVDSSGGAIALADAHRAELDLTNLRFIQSDFTTAADRLDGPFDFILAHGVLSWVPDDVRDSLLALCARHLRPGGIVYLNYNTKPGWNVRGMVRDFLLAQTATAAVSGLRRRAELAQELAAKVASSLAATIEHPYMRLMEREFRFVCQNDLSYVAHEFLATDNHAYWRSEFLALARGHGLEVVADADFNCSSGRIPPALAESIAAAELVGQPIEDTVDLLSYRQLHSPILALGTWTPRPPDAAELADLLVASCLEPTSRDEKASGLFRHPSGVEVEAKGAAIRGALERLPPLWPRGLHARVLCGDPGSIMDDLRLLHYHGLIDLRLVENSQLSPPSGPLNERERRWRGLHVTTPYHTQEAVAT